MKAQCLTYLRMLGLRVGLVLNFGLPTLKEGIQHVINETKEEYLARLRKERPSVYYAVLEEEKADTAVFDGAQAHLQNTPRVSEVSVTSVVAPQAGDSDTEEGL